MLPLLYNRGKIPGAVYRNYCLPLSGIWIEDLPVWLKWEIDSSGYGSMTLNPDKFASHTSYMFM